MTEPAHSQNIASLEAAIPAAPLESILCTDELLKCPRRPPDHERENSALAALVSAVADSPRTILQTLADKILELLDADSAGLSLLTKDGNRFYWAAIAGAWRPHLGGGTPRDFGPCGDVLDCNTTMLFTHRERRYPYLSAAMPLAEEGLLAPFFVNGKAVGTIWVIAHRNHRNFDAEDQRLLESMGRFASAAYQTVESIEELKSEVVAREKVEAELRELTDSLERQVRARTRELEHRNEALAKARSELAHVSRVTGLGVLTASIAHEVNQPITAAVTYAQAALRWISAEPPDLGEVSEALTLIVKEGNRAGEVVARTRALTKKVPARKDAVAINDAILEVIALTRTEAANNGVLVRTQLAEGLPPVQGDRVQLQQVMLNLIVNAIQAMSGIGEGARELQISIDAVPSEGGVRVGVRDTGPGLSPESLSRLFEPFYTTKPEGMGMGLSICRSIIEAHGGRLWAIPCEPQGALFQFTIPAD